MAVIAGDIEGGNLLKRLGVLLTDFLLFDNEDNDLVVDTAVHARRHRADEPRSRVLFDRGADVSHFRYFTNHDTRSALRDWLVGDDPRELKSFRRAARAPTNSRPRSPAAATASRVGRGGRPPGGGGAAGRHGLAPEGRRDDRVWFDLPDLVAGGLDKIGWDQPGVEADDLFARIYGKLCEHLATQPPRRALRLRLAPAARRARRAPRQLPRHS